LIISRAKEKSIDGIYRKTRTNMIFMGKPEGKRLLGRPRLRWEDNIKMKIKDSEPIDSRRALSLSAFHSFMLEIMICT
jgi:hypothetical protein